MATVTKLGPLDQGRPMTLDEFMAGDYQEGYQYELIDGRLYVSPSPNLPEARVDLWIFRKVQRYAEDNPEVINFVYNKVRVFVPGRPGVTNPEPDLAAYHRFPLHLPFREVRWQDVSPLLVGEVLSLDDPDKDLVRNVELYFQVPTIKEYWLFDTREDPEQPRLRVHRRHGRKWRLIDLSYGEVYTTKLLPGFELLLDPHR
jgi:Uma2 family endonuclease